MAKFMTSAETRERERFYALYARLQQAVSYAQALSDEAPDLPGLSVRGRELLSAARGKELAKGWAEAFVETTALLERFTSDDLAGRSQPAKGDFEAVYEATNRALTALVRRLNLLAGRSDPPASQSA